MGKMECGGELQGKEGGRGGSGEGCRDKGAGKSGPGKKCAGVAQLLPPVEAGKACYV